MHPRRFFFLTILCAAYIGVYLCRKNLTVAVPLLERAWGLSKERLGLIASISTLAYASGKFLFGPVTDRIGGRRSLFGSMILVALFGLFGALVPGLWGLVVIYSLNRLCGSASWGAMVKLVPEWFAPAELPIACGLLSLSFVFGGALAVAFAGWVASATQDSWQAVLAAPSALLLLLVAACWLVLPRKQTARVPDEAATAVDPRPRRNVLELLRNRKFLVVLGLSFTLTLLRETFNFWTVDFLETEGGPTVSSATAAMLATPFDLCGAAGIVFLGWIYGRLRPRGRQSVLVAMMLLLAALLVILPSLFHRGLWVLSAGIGCIGFLVYGPYSLLGGVLSVEVSGKEYAATVSGWVDGTGYIAGFVSGVLFGRLLTLGGYRLGFSFMAGLTVIAAFQCVLLYRKETRGAKLAEAAADVVPGT